MCSFGCTFYRTAGEADEDKCPFAHVSMIVRARGELERIDLVMGSVG